MEIIPWASGEGNTFQLTYAEAEQLIVLIEEAVNGREAEGDKLDIEIVEE